MSHRRLDNPTLIVPFSTLNPSIDFNVANFFDFPAEGWLNQGTDRGVVITEDPDRCDRVTDACGMTNTEYSGACAILHFNGRSVSVQGAYPCLDIDTPGNGRCSNHLSLGVTMDHQLQVDSGNTAIRQARSEGVHCDSLRLSASQPPESDWFSLWEARARGQKQESTVVNQDEHFDPQDALIPKVHVYDSGPFEVAFGPAGGMETANIGDFVLIKFFETSIEAYGNPESFAILSASIDSGEPQTIETQWTTNASVTLFSEGAGDLNAHDRHTLNLTLLSLSSLQSSPGPRRNRFTFRGFKYTPSYKTREEGEIMHGEWVKKTDY
ncbi:hypothetical protein BDV98DRAFT_655098 [Pterulicium gracile]|uniref:Uncharacterized protein n=1 Tax=Pterulicium gracile TaxID=1884261 RepID=A0A5C3QM50_9AGAR|nr:hypothetical protein BDV98DRAFT_655098 [Pterula gracilis]